MIPAGTIRISDPDQIGRMISDLRILNRLTQRGLATESGYRQGRISEWELGKKYPQISSLIAIAATFGYDLALVPREDA